ncbi:MAG: phage terminase large subunit [Candidatus Omnitrophica bacterium]|nr:phage terminase large subunit [Candidatus Omnitrophota bacterium]
MFDHLRQDTYSLMRKNGQESLLVFGKLFLADHLQCPPSEAHRKLYGILEDATRTRGQKIAIAAPRDFGKSTLVTLIYVLYSIVYKQDLYIMLLSNTAGQAITLLEHVKREAIDNEKLIEVFPDVFKQKPLVWRQNEVVFANGVKVAAFGSGQQIRGRRHGKVRPTLVIGDDLENAESALSTKTQEHIREWLTKTVLKIGSVNTNYLLLGNLYHPCSLLSEYLHLPGWTREILKAIIDWPTNIGLWDSWRNIYNSRTTYNEKSGPEAALKFYCANKDAMDAGARLLWPEKQPLYQLMLQKEEDEASFMSEFQNEPFDPRDRIFNLEELHYWSDNYSSVEELLHFLGHNAELYGACDPSLGEHSFKGDFSAIIILVKDKRDKCLYIIEADIKRRSVDDLLNDILAYYRRHTFTKFVVEANQFQTVVIDQLVDRAKAQGLYFVPPKVINTTNKIKRIQAIQPLTKNGTIKFSKSFRRLLEECMYFPRGQHDDGLDALEMAVRAAEYKGRFVTAKIL